MFSAKLIQTINQFSKINKIQLAKIEAISKNTTVGKNDVLQNIGHTCKTLYFVESGLLRIFYLKDGNDITESFETENSFVARAESLFSNSPSQKGIQALEKTELISINTQKLFDLFEENPEIERLFRKIIELSYVKTIQRIESLQFHTAEERYLNLLNEFPEIIQRVQLKHIASYLGITQVSLSRIRAKI